MGGKHLKRLRAEKSKVHLKKNVLQKGQNVTNTTFTVKKILTVEQLKKVDQNEPVSNWNVPLKDLLIRLNHYNFNSRLNSLSGIKEILTKNPEILKGPSLKSLISRLLELLTDEEHKIRVKAIELLSYLFDFLPSSASLPFHDILNVHLGCAMTHRSATVQHDSLKFIDFMIKYSPQAIKHNFTSIIHNFIRIIKNCLYEGHAGVFLSKKSKQDLEKAKAELLFKFYNFLAVGYSNVENEKPFDYKKINVNFLSQQNFSLRELSDQYKKVPSLTLFKSSENKEIIFTEFDSSKFQSLCTLVIPLLFDIWLEYCPNQVTTECVLAENVGELLFSILKILLLFYERVKASENTEMEQWFISKYGPQFQKSFTSNFPYLPLVSVKNSESSIGNNFSRENYDSYMMQNLAISYLSYSFGIVPKNSIMETKMENYICSALMMKNPTEIEILSKAVEAVINASNYKNSNILSKCAAAQNSSSSLELRQSLSKILMGIVLKGNETMFQKDDVMVNWMKSLPDHLCKSKICMQEIEHILKLINRSRAAEVLRDILECDAQKIANYLPNIKIEGAPQLEGQKMIVNILYRCSNKILEQIIKNNISEGTLYPEDLRNYMMDIFSQKLRNHFLDYIWSDQ